MPLRSKSGQSRSLIKFYSGAGAGAEAGTASKRTGSATLFKAISIMKNLKQKLNTLLLFSLKKLACYIL
jgi:hypothetical protein